jgi:Ni/Fe-hydrogenase subunit HybB-like protein
MITLIAYGLAIVSPMVLVLGLAAGGLAVAESVCVVRRRLSEHVNA